MNNFLRSLCIILNCLLVTQCIPSNKKLKVQDNFSSGGTSSINPNQALLNLEVNAGMKPFEELYMSMATVVGIDPSANSTIRTIYNNNSASLPTYDDLKTFSSAEQLAISRMASEICNLSLNNSPSRAMLWPNINFNQGPAVTLTPALRNHVIEQMIVKFWNDIPSEEEKIYIYDEINQLFDELLPGEGTNSAATIRIMKAICTVGLASSYITLK